MGRGGHDYFKLRGVKGPEYAPIYRNKERIQEGDYEGYLTTRLTEEAVSFIDRQKQKPFFLYLAYNAVHAPAQAPKEDIDRITKRSFQNSTKSARSSWRCFIIWISALDAVVKKLKDKGLWENTLSIFPD